MKNGILAGVVAVTFALPLISFAADAPAGEPAKTPVAGAEKPAKEKPPAQAQKSKAEKAPAEKKAE